MTRREMPGRDRQSDDRGMTIVFLALVLVVLMIFAAFSVDIGTAYAQRRQNQGSVDTAALAGGVKFVTTGSFENAIIDVKARVADDMGTAITDADWASCTDPNALATSSLVYSPTEGSPCISFGEDPNSDELQMRVRLPDVTNSTAFAKVIGIDELQTHAVAVVGITPPIPMFPSAITTGLSAGSVVCIVADSSGQNAPCVGQNGGQFGQLFNPVYYRSTPPCIDNIGTNNGTDWSTFAPAMAEGLDHQLMPDPDFDPTDPTANERRNGGNNCTVWGPNALEAVTGNPAPGTITAGMILGRSGSEPTYTGRLAGGPYSHGGTYNAAKMGGVDIDNAPLWAFLKPSLPASAPLACRVAAQMPVKRDVAASAQVQVTMGLTPDGVQPMYKTPEKVMTACLGAWTMDDGPIFTNDVAESRRAVNVPRYWETTPVTSGFNHIRDFVPAFLTGEYQSVPSCPGSYGVPNGTQACIDAVGADPSKTHWAGTAITDSSTWNKPNTTLNGVAGIFIPCGSLPETICRPDPSDPEGFGGVVQIVKLTG